MANDSSIPWEYVTKLDIDELDGASLDILGDKSQEGQGLIEAVAHASNDRHMPDDLKDSGTEHTAVVLRVLSGPQARNEATTSGGQLRKSMNIESAKGPLGNIKKNAKSYNQVAVIAHVFKFDPLLSLPDKNDSLRLFEEKINMHSEFVQESNETWHGEIREGSIIKIVYPDRNNHSGYNGRPSGYISKLIDGPPLKVEQDPPPAPPKEKFEAVCRGQRQLAEPALQLYHGQTVANPNVFAGPPIRKVKNIIKTGFYGNGTPQTKAHFDEALKKSEMSPKHSIPGPTPGSNNSFIWVGHLRNNGYMDLVDRPITAGRETIIYAPMTLDLSSPIEIKYYFHDNGGFGHSWINGPAQKVEHSSENANIKNNDFRTKIAPGIKDLIKDGRNFVLVIPEMSYSRGFGTATNGSKRTDAIASGDSVTDQSAGPMLDGETIRSHIAPSARAAVKRYLKKIPIDSNNNNSLLNITEMINRKFSTFDASITGGKFGDFHQEVIEVLEEHFGTIYEKINFISVIGDGLGAIALSSLGQFIPIDAKRIEATKSFRSVKINRIDYIDTGIDNKSYYTFDTTPLQVFYDDYLSYRASQGQHIEMNYITEYSERSNKSKSFFEYLNRGNTYTSNYKPTMELGERKFTFYINNNSTSKAFVSMHTTKKSTIKKRHKVGYAMSMVNDFLGTSNTLLKKSNSQQKPSQDSVPDHASTCSSMPSASAILDAVQYKLEALASKITWFELLLLEIMGSENYGNSLCENPEYKLFCDQTNTFVHDEYSLLWTTYLEYLDNKKLYWQIKFNGMHERKIEKIINNKELLKSYRDDVVTLQLNALKPQYQNWLNYYSFLRLPNQSFDVGGLDLNILDPDLVGGGDVETGTISDAARQIAEKEVLESLIPKIDKAIKKASPPPSGIPKQCDPPPLKLKNVSRPKPPGIPEASTSPTIICKEKEISVVDSTEDLLKIIPYIPEKQTFQFKRRRSVTGVNLDKQNINYEIKKFKYKARRTSGTTYLESPPIWSCLTEHLQVAWNEACAISGYTPFYISDGIRGSFNNPGITAYSKGLSAHALGLAIDIDPFLAGNNSRGKPVYSVFTGAWDNLLLESHGEDLYNLGVYRKNHKKLLKNAYQDMEKKITRKADNWATAPDAYKKEKEKYINIMKDAKDIEIITKSANPLKWAVIFCEKSGMRWGNALFLKKRWKGPKVWTPPEQKLISDMLGVKNVVKRVQAISWKNNEIDDHMHFQYWAGGSVIPWQKKS